MRRTNRILVFILFLPLILVFGRIGLNAAITRIYDCKFSKGRLEPCFVNGVDWSESIYSFNVGLGFVIIPGLLLWFILFGIVIWVANIIDGRKRDQ
jgi:hypothetical protein